MSASCLNLDTKVRHIVNSCRSVNLLHPLVSQLCQSPEFEQIFCSSLDHDLNVICQRSQNLAHGEITAAQKAFAVLMEKEEDLFPAIGLYVDEILGLRFVSESDRAITLNNMIQTRHSIRDQAYGSKPHQSSTARNAALPSSSQSALSDHKSDDSGGSRTLNLLHIADEHDETCGDEKLKRLFIVYHKARKDFDASPAKTRERTRSAKFLRDTTENCLAYIAAKQTRPAGLKVEVTCDGKMQDELRATLEETKAIAEQGSGGKKRRFDENWENVPQEPVRMRGLSVAQPSGKPDPVPRGRTSQKKRRPVTSRISLGPHSYQNEGREARPDSKTSRAGTKPQQVSPKSDYRQQSANLAERRRSDLPHQLYPASAGQTVRRVFGDRHKPHADQSPFSGGVYGDRYRPTYR